MPECLYLTLRKTVIKMFSWDNIAWFIIFIILYVSFISQDHDGDDYLVFLSKARIFCIVDI